MTAPDRASVEELEAALSKATFRPHKDAFAAAGELIRRARALDEAEKTLRLARDVIAACELVVAGNVGSHDGIGAMRALEGAYTAFLAAAPDATGTPVRGSA